jgi:hypothetical protein
MRAKYYWLKMHSSRGTCPPIVHVDCCFSEATCYGPAHSSSLLWSSHHHHINIIFFSRYDIAQTLLPRRYTNTTQSPEVFMKAFRSFAFKRNILVLIGNLGQPKQMFIVLIWIIRHVPLVEQELFLHYLKTQVRSQSLKFSEILVV